MSPAAPLSALLSEKREWNRGLLITNRLLSLGDRRRFFFFPFRLTHSKERFFYVQSFD